MNDSNIETKVVGRDAGAAFGEFMAVFEAFKEENDRRLAEIAAKGAADTLTSEKVERLNARLDELQLKAQRPQLSSKDVGHTGRGSAIELQHKAAFDAYVRKGEAATLRAVESKALSVGSDPDGGYLVPDQLEATINASLRSISPIRAIAGIQPVSGMVYKRPFSTSGAATGWIGETAARPQTTAPTLAELSFPTMELYAMPAATSSLLDDSAVNIDTWLADEVRISFAEQEGAAFVNGDGVNKPKGFLAYDTVDNGAWVWGKLGFIATGAAGALPAANPGDKLIDLAYAVKAPYRANATFVMNRTTLAVLRKLKDGQGNYLWQPANAPGEASTLMGYAVAEAEDMPDIAAGSPAIAFGDFSRGYLIVDRVGIRVLRDPYSAKPYVLFYTTKRVGGGVQDFAAIKLLKFQA